MDLQKLHSNLKKLDVVDLAYRVLDDMSTFIADLNRERLIKEGKDSDGNSLQDYTETTVILKEAFGQGLGKITDHTTLYNTGAYHKSIFASVIGDELIVDATDSKTMELEEKYPDNLGLTKKEIQLVSAEFDKRFFPLLEKAIWA